MIKLLTAFSILFLPLFSLAQFSDSLTHFTRFSVSGNINQTNSATTSLLNNDVRFSVKKPRTVLNASAGWVYGVQSNVVTNNDFTSTLDFNLYNKIGNFYEWGLANYNTSLSLRIRNQLQTGAGIAYNIVNNKSAWLNISDGLLYETSSITVSDSVNENYHTFRNSLRLVYRFVFWNTVTLNGTHFLQNSLSNDKDYIMRSNSSASVKLYKWLSFTTSVNYNQFRRTGKKNLLFAYGLAAETYF